MNEYFQFRVDQVFQGVYNRFGLIPDLGIQLGKIAVTP